MIALRAPRVCFYARCFRSPAPSCGCFEAQIARALRWSAERRFALVDIIVEDLVGAAAFNRPRFNLMLASTDHPPAPFDLILVDTRDHFSRNASRLTYTIEDLRRRKVSVEAVTGKIPANFA